MFNLNDNSLLGNAIFNNGEAGRVKNVTVSVERKALDDMGAGPDVKFHFTDEQGASINDGYFKYSEAPEKSKEDNEKIARMRLGRLLAISNSLVEPGYQYPSTEGASVNQIEELLINTIANHATPERKVNIFVNYGRTSNPSQYLRVRNFDFIEHASVDDNRTRLVVKKDDNMTRMEPDTMPQKPNTGGFGSIPPAQGNNGGFWSNN